MRIGPLTLRDIRAMHRLERDIFPKDAYPYPDLALLLLWPRVVNLKASGPSGDLWGIASLSLPLLPASPAWVVTLGVAPAQQRRGIGGELLTALEARTHAPRLRLTVRRGNTPAIELYHKMGYTVQRIGTRYYPDGEDGLIMEKGR